MTSIMSSNNFISSSFIPTFLGRDLRDGGRVVVAYSACFTLVTILVCFLCSSSVCCFCFTLVTSFDLVFPSFNLIFSTSSMRLFPSPNLILGLFRSTASSNLIFSTSSMHLFRSYNLIFFTSTMRLFRSTTSSKLIFSTTCFCDLSSDLCFLHSFSSSDLCFDLISSTSTMLLFHSTTSSKLIFSTTCFCESYFRLELLLFTR
ncbi:MAG: hypothetical protein ACI8RD_010016 [Bacillariaceae sp.]|jgi:hypothetical protein